MKGIWRSMVLLLVPMAAMPASHHDAHSQPTANADWAELQKSMQAMHAAMASEAPSGDSDADFVRLMLPHHQAAIDMAKAQLANGKDAQMRRLAQEIITDQQSEIELMQLWLKHHGPRTARAGTIPTFKTSEGK